MLIRVRIKLECDLKLSFVSRYESAKRVFNHHHQVIPDWKPFAFARDELVQVSSDFSVIPRNRR